MFQKKKITRNLLTNQKNSLELGVVQSFLIRIFNIQSVYSYNGEHSRSWLKVEVCTFHHNIFLLVMALIFLTGTKDRPQSKRFSKILPISVQSSDSGHPHSFYIFPRVKRRKEALYNLLLSCQVEARRRWSHQTWGTWWRR